MPKCSYCGKNYKWPRGLTYVKTDGTVLYFCSSKCRKNWKLGRKSKKVRWIKKEKKEKQKKEKSEVEKVNKKEEKEIEKKTEEAEKKTENPKN